MDINYSQNVTQSFQNAYNNVVVKAGSFLPNLVSAIVILLIGWIIANFAGWAVKGLLKASGVDALAQKLGLQDIFKRAGFTLTIAGLVSWSVWWFIMVVTFIAAADSLNLPQVSAFIDQVAAYIPNVVAAALILMIGIVVADVLSEAVDKAVALTKYVPADLLASFTKWAVLIFSFLAALAQLNIATTLIQILFGGIIFAVSLALGLSFGLGGRDVAKNILEKSASVANRSTNARVVAKTVVPNRKNQRRKR